ncbi:hypothetical protein L7F22_036921 [Adiantum nelumboides]|nr:hypothetical protein [Adiantum nelumboides]
MMSAATAAPCGSSHWGVAISKTPPGLLQRSECASLSLHAEVGGGSSAEYQFATRKRHCAASLSWGFALCKDSKLREICLASKNYVRRMGGVRATHSSLTQTSFSTRSTELSTSSYNAFNTKPNPSRPPFQIRDQEEEEVGVQELTVYEVNQLDRWSPMLLSLSKLALDWYNRFRVQPLNSLGDLVPFTNKIFDGSLKKRLGITAGIISVMRHYPKQDALLFESVYSFYFGDYGHISVKGPYKTHEDTVLTVTGGSGVFTGVYGTVLIHNVEYPIVLFYKFQLYGIPRLPQALQWDTVPPTKGVRPSHTASMPGFALPNFTE